MTKKLKQIRVFLGLPIPEARVVVLRKLIIENHPKIEHNVRWVKPGNHHITVQFLGNIAEEKIPSLTLALENSLPPLEPFDVVLRKITLFPTHEAGVVAISIQPSLILQKLHDTVGLIMKSEGITPEKRIYNPHITMFRSMKHSKIKFKSIFLNNEKIKIHCLTCYKSLPEAGGSVYVPLHTLSFEH